jgi:hypothetical protein
MKNLMTMIMIIAAQQCAFAGQDSGGVSPGQFIQKTYAFSVLDDTKDVPLWPARIEFSFAEKRMYQGDFPDVLKGLILILVPEFIDFFKIEPMNTEFTYERITDEGQLVRPGHDEFMQVYKSIVQSTVGSSGKIVPTVKHSIGKVLAVFYPNSDPSRIVKCRIREVESAQIDFKTEGNFTFKRLVYEETEVDPGKCPVEEFKKVDDKNLWVTHREYFF